MPDILYLLLPIGGAFMLLFLVCFCGRKVKEVFQYPKDLLDLSHNLNHRPRRKSSDESDDEFLPRYTIRTTHKKSKFSKLLYFFNRKKKNRCEDKHLAAVEMEQLCQVLSRDEGIRQSFDASQGLIMVPACLDHVSSHPSRPRTSHSQDFHRVVVPKDSSEPLEGSSKSYPSFSNSRSLPDIHHYRQ